MSPEVAERVPTLARSLYPDKTPEIIFHPQCFASHGHFAGDDETRARAFLDIANDESYDAVWFGRGGYGSCRMVEAVMCRLTELSRRKAYVGYSDTGVLLAALYRAGFEAVAHGPVAQDILRDAGDVAVERALAWMVDRSPEALEPTVSRVKKTAAFNMSVLSQILGTPLQPNLDEHVLMLEEVGEAMYRIDRSLFHITSNAEIRRVSGVMLGRCSGVTEVSLRVRNSHRIQRRRQCRDHLIAHRAGLTRDKVRAQIGRGVPLAGLVEAALTIVAG